MTEEKINSLHDWMLKLESFGKITEDLIYWTLGRIYGYKDCCIKNYVNLHELGFMPAYWMYLNIGPGSRKPFVECVLCRESLKPEELDWSTYRSFINMRK